MATELKHIIDQINALQTEVDTYRPLTSEQTARLTQKLRLDWNYHSCNIEGNTLTYGETKALLLHGITAKGKPFKDHLEIKGHNEAVEYIYDVVKQKERLTETFIRELHSIIMPPDTYSEGRTLDGKPSRKKILVGQYKRLPNHVLTKTGETFYFASPEETPAKMEELMAWYRKVSEEKKDHPLLIACIFHYRFVRIHPFDDGNGRISRILMNFILMMNGFPPAIIPTDERTSYITALELADEGEIDQFVMFVGEQLVKSLSLLKKVALGESIEEEGDLDKMLAMLDRQLEGLDEDQSVKTERSIDVQKTLFQSSFEPFIQSTLSTLGKFDRYFKKVEIDLRMDNLKMGKWKYSGIVRSNIITNIKEHIGKNDLSTISISYGYQAFEKLGLADYKETIHLNIHFKEFFYQAEVFSRTGSTESHFIKAKKLYHQIISPNEIVEVSQKVSSYMLSQIQAELKKVQEKGNQTK